MWLCPDGESRATFSAATRTLQPGAGALPFHLLSKCYDRSSVVIATSLSLSERAIVLGDAQMKIALRDRLTHRCHIEEAGNASLRFKVGSAAAKRKMRGETMS